MQPLHLLKQRNGTGCNFCIFSIGMQRLDKPDKSQLRSHSPPPLETMTDTQQRITPPLETMPDTLNPVGRQWLTQKYVPRVFMTPRRDDTDAFATQLYEVMDRHRLSIIRLDPVFEAWCFEIISRTPHGQILAFKYPHLAKRMCVLAGKVRVGDTASFVQNVVSFFSGQIKTETFQEVIRDQLVPLTCVEWAIPLTRNWWRNLWEEQCILFADYFSVHGNTQADRREWRQLRDGGVLHGPKIEAGRNHSLGDLDALPPEILRMVLKRLPGGALRSVAATCKGMYTAVKGCCPSQSLPDPVACHEYAHLSFGLVRWHFPGEEEMWRLRFNLNRHTERCATFGVDPLHPRCYTLPSGDSALTDMQIERWSVLVGAVLQSEAHAKWIGDFFTPRKGIRDAQVDVSCWVRAGDLCTVRQIRDTALALGYRQVPRAAYLKTALAFDLPDMFMYLWAEGARAKGIYMECITGGRVKCLRAIDAAPGTRTEMDMYDAGKDNTAMLAYLSTRDKP